MNTYQATRLVAAREIKVKLRDKTFLYGTLVFLLIAIASTVLPAMLQGGPSTVAAPAAAAGPLRAAGLDVLVVADDAAAERAVRDGDADAALVAGPTVLGDQRAPDDVVQALSVAPQVRLLDPDAVDPVTAYLVPFAFAFVFFIMSQTFGIQVAQSVTEEKQTRIVEILVAAVPVRALLAGKIVAAGALALGQVALIAVAAVAGLRLTGGGDLLALVAPALGWFVPFFLLGFLLLAAMWAAAGALVNRQEDIAGASTPVQLAVMAPFFAVVFLNDNATAMRILSYLPLSAPTAMPVRLFTGDAATWEPFVALALLLVAAAGFLAAGARIYQGSLLRTNGRTSVRAAWRQRETVG
ncbi:ABC-2 type transport system permease protein [Micromonospora sediminicola]|uniref:ABC-2 type transport system permease protein n=1 Tax=Micromonospora sediminicola TaxID=946078 RepID=A0A1A9BF35_9ACTN|nr:MULTISPECIES: ABC transporter permease [Micromonospora]PGH45559.1 ABC transporter permease [Micromonospora sp. WMMA1996]SBT67472.1 ABC-2 type transport system permease protein [Micromonospora sediminicola]